MKKLIALGAVTTLVGIGLAASLIVGNPFRGDGSGTAVNHEGHIDSDHWICVMDPDVLSDEPGTCPVCGMDLVRKAERAPAAESPSAPDAGAVPDARE